MTFAYVGLGSNAGARRRHLAAAARLLGRLRGARLCAVSPLYASDPLGCPGRQSVYYNAVAELQTTQPPPRIFSQLRRVERRVQKKPRAQNTPRRLDVDYLAHGSCRRTNRHLTLPHPRLYRRAFVLQPMDDLLAARRTAGVAPLQTKVQKARQRHCGGQTLCRLS